MLYTWNMILYVKYNWKFFFKLFKKRREKKENVVEYNRLGNYHKSHIAKVLFRETIHPHVQMCARRPDGPRISSLGFQ